MRIDGRIEKRFPTAVPVYVVSSNGPRTVDRALTENVSPHGVRLITGQPWQPDESLLITPPTGEFQVQGRVVYCRPLPNGRFSVGLEFRGRPINWAEWPRGYLPAF